MFLQKYLYDYLMLYKQVNLPGIGTIFLKEIPAQRKEDKLYPPGTEFILKEEISNTFDHFVVYIMQFEKKEFSEIQGQILSDIRYINAQLHDDNTFYLESIGYLRYFKNTVSLFKDSENNFSNYGYPIL